MGGRVNDAQGVIASKASEWTPHQLLQACGLNGWVFEHALSEQVPLAPYMRQTHASPFIDLSAGFEAYYQQQRESGGSRIVQFLRKLRNIGA